MQRYVLLISLSILIVQALQPQPPAASANQEAAKESIKCINIATGAPSKCPANVPLQGNVLEPQFQYTPFNYVPNIPNKQLFPRVQPPLVFYGGAAPPGQQFLYRPGSPPGNFLIPQPQPHPGVIFGQPQGPTFTAGYPRPAHIPPIEKDAEEVPNLAGNHPPTQTGRPIVRPPQTRGTPEKLETLDEPVINGEADEGERNANNFNTKRRVPTQPSLRPGHQFFILNGQPLFSNYPLEVRGPQPNYQPNYFQTNPELFIHRQPVQPQVIPELDAQRFNQFPIKNFFFRNSVTGEIEDVKPFQGSVTDDIVLQGNTGNYISLNNPNDIKEKLFLRGPGRLEPLYIQQQNIPLELPKEYQLTAPLVKDIGIAEQRQGKGIEFPILLNGYNRGFIYPDITSLADNFRYGYQNLKEEDDTIVIDAKTQNDEKESEDLKSTPKAEEASLSQAQPVAVALSGKGGVASAGPRGTALVGLRGLAIASPQATAVAGPKKEESEKRKKSKKEQR